jgi:hypothetical protein
VLGQFDFHPDAGLRLSSTERRHFNNEAYRVFRAAYSVRHCWYLALAFHGDSAAERRA